MNNDLRFLRFTVGHPAYDNVNRCKVHTTWHNAELDLLARGVPQSEIDLARNPVEAAKFTVVQTRCGHVIEISSRYVPRAACTI